MKQPEKCAFNLSMARSLLRPWRGKLPKYFVSFEHKSLHTTDYNSQYKMQKLKYF